MNLAHCNLKELTLEEINSVSGGDRGEAAVAAAIAGGSAGFSLGGALGGPLGSAIGGVAGVVVGAYTGAEIYDEFAEGDPENMSDS